MLSSKLLVFDADDDARLDEVGFDDLLLHVDNVALGSGIFPTRISGLKRDLHNLRHRALSVSSGYEVEINFKDYSDVLHRL